MTNTATRPRGIPAPTKVLALLCAMYFINYICRVNVSTASAVFQPELHLTNTQVGLIFSAFGYPYLAFQVAGGWVADRFGARRALTVFAIIWSSATVLMGLANSLSGMILGRVLLGIGVSALPVATRAMSNWTPAERRGFAQGITHAFARLGNALTPPLVAWLILLVSWRGSFVVIGTVSFVWALVWGIYFRDDPAEHPGITADDLETASAAAREAGRAGAVCAARLADAARHARLLLLRLDVVVLPGLDSVLLPPQLPIEVEQFGAVLLGCVPRRHLRRLPRGRHQRSHPWIEEELLDVLGETGVGCIAFSPLAQGMLTRKYLGGILEGSRASRESSLSLGPAEREEPRARPRAERDGEGAWPDPRADGARVGAARRAGDVGDRRRQQRRPARRQSRRAGQAPLRRRGAGPDRRARGRRGHQPLGAVRGGLTAQGKPP